MSDHFIKNIEIKNFKCFENFKAEGFSRVNLIGGKNNVGKTAFMEACYISSNYALKITKNPDFKNNYGANKIEKEWMYFEIIKSLIVIQNNREQLDFLSEWIKEEVQLATYSNCLLILNNTHKINMDGSNLYTEYRYTSWSFYKSTSLNNFQNNKYYYKIFKKNNPPQLYNTLFVTPCNSNHYNIKDMIDTLKIENQYKKIKTMLNNVFNISSIDVIKNKVMIKDNKDFKDLNDFGDGFKHFLNIILALLVNKDNVVYLDEIENGIHYTNLDKLWEIILIISKQQNVQVFATTHSKECIESYARVAKRLGDEEITMTTLARNPKGEIKALVWNQKQFFSEMEQNHEVRGW